MASKTGIDKVNKIIELSNSELNMTQVAKIVGVTHKVVNRVAKEYDLQFAKASNAKLSYDEEQKVISLFVEGYNTKDISEKMCLNQQRVYKTLKRNGYKVPKNQITITQSMKNNIYSMYKDGISTVNIAQKYNICDRTVVKIIKENGIKIRRPGSKSLVLNERYFDTIDTELKAYFLGFIVADGNVRISKNGIKTFQMMLQSSDKYVLEKLLDELGCYVRKYNEETEKMTNLKVKPRYIKSKDEYNIQIHNQYIYDDLVSHGIVPNKTFATYIPSGIPEELIRHFIRGLFDGDGCITISNAKYKNARVIFYGQDSILIPLQKILELNIPSLSKVKIFKKPTLSMLSYAAKQNVIDLYNYLYKDSTFYLTRKREKFISYINT